MFLKKNNNKKMRLMRNFKLKGKSKKNKVKIRKGLLRLPQKNTKGETEVRKIYEENKLTLPHLPLNDAFLCTMNSLFKALRFLAIPVVGGYFVVACYAIHISMIVVLDLAAVWKVFKVIAGKALYSTGNRSVIARISGFIFYANAVCSLVLLWRLRGSWKKLKVEWASTERSTGLHLPPDPKLRMKMIFIIIAVVAGSIIEHGMSMASALKDIEGTPAEFFEKYIITSHAFIMIQSDYDLRLGIAIFIVNKTATFLWNLQDMLIILFSVGLTSRYRRLNLVVKGVEEKISEKNDMNDYDEHVETQLWRRLREAYVRQAALVRRVDQDLGPFILLCNSNNFFFICLQLFNGFGGISSKSLINSLYFGVSISWLFLRACGVVLAAANINIQSKEALRSIHAYPEEFYNVEVRRLEQQLSKDFVALTGMGFFQLNRNMLLEVAAAIFRYELILLEFDR